MAQSLIGNLAVLLSMDTAAFEKGNSHASKLLRKTQREFAAVGDKMKGVGEGLSKWITLPVLGAGAATLKMAGDFETAMNQVSISTNATAAEMDAMKKLALDIGKSTTKSAKESAEAMDMLAKAGVSTKDILNGTAKATVALAEAAGSDLEPAAAAITDSMSQFKLTTKDLPMIINQVTGAVNESKFSFQDFTLGMAQGGGVAASAGVSFTDFATTLAATSSQFASGADAGTSLKTFLLSLTPATKKAKAAFDEAGFSAYDAQGNMKSMAVIAEDLRTKFGGLSEQDLNATFKEMFGTDAIRTAIGLMRQGGDGFAAMQAKITGTDASDQAAKRMRGFAAEMEKLRGAIETLAIKVADSGLLSAMTGLITKIGEWVEWMADASPTTLKWAVGIAAVTAAVGPLLIGLGAIVNAVGVMLPLIVKLGPVFTILGSALTYVIPVLLGVGKALLALTLTPLGAFIVILGAAYVAWQNWDKIGPIVTKMVAQVKAALFGTLTKVLNGVREKVEQVKHAFWDMADKVTFRSYVPDMVDIISQQMDRLGPEMVDKVTKATQTAKEKFKQLTDDARSMFNELFPEMKALEDFRKKMADVDKFQKAGIYSPDFAAEAKNRLRNIDPEVPIGGAPLPETVEVADDIEKLSEHFKKLGDDAAKLSEKWENAAYAVVGLLQDLFGGGKTGRVLGSLLQGGLDIARAFGAFGGARARGGPVVPGKTYLVGEEGPEWVTPSRRGFVHPNGSGGGMSRVQIVPSPYFNAVVDSRAAGVAAPMAGRAAMTGAAGGMAGVARQRRRAIP